MTATLEQLIQVRSQLAEETLAYLDGLAERSAELPKYYPAHLRAAEAGKTPFDDIRQMVQVVEDRSAFERWLAEERERMRAAGQDFGRIAYKPKRSLMEDEESDERGYARRDRPAPPPPFQWDENAGSGFKRAVILGDPGFGKTWLLRYEARRLARTAADQLRNSLCDLDQITLPIFVRLSELNQSDSPIENALVEAIGAGRSAVFCHLAREKLATDRCVILFDAWDEVPIEVSPPGQPLAFKPHHRQRLGQRLDAFARQFTQPRLLLTSRIVGYDQSPIPDLPGQEQVKEIELLAFNTPQIESFVRVWYDNDHDAANQFLAMLRQNHQVRGLARIPLMLTLLCRVWAENKEKKRDFPMRRVELYDRCLRGLLRDWKIDDKGHELEDESVSEAYMEAIIEMLQGVGYELFAKGYEQFSPALLRTKMQQWLAQLKPAHELYGRTPASLIAELKRDGLLIIVGEHRDAPLLFLHRTFQEYLTACALAEQANQKWKAIAPFVNEKASVPEWGEVIVLLSGSLNDPTPLLKLLKNPRYDDLFRHRLCLAAQCLPELSRGCQSWLEKTIASEVVKLWLKYQKHDIYFMHISRCLRAGIQSSPESISHLLASLYKWGNKVRWVAADTLGQIGEAAAQHPEVFPILVKIVLHDADEEVRGSAAWALGQIGGVAATETVLSALVTALHDADGYVRACAAFALGQMGSAAAREEVLTALVQMGQHDPNDRMRPRAASALGQMGSAAASEEVLTALAELALHATDDRVRESAASALGQMGSAAAREEVLTTLVEVALHATDDRVRESAVSALGQMGSAAAREIVLTALVQMVHHDDRVRDSAASALGRMGSTAAREEVLTALVAALYDAEYWVRERAASALGQMGSTAAREEVLTALDVALYDVNDNVRSRAASALGQMGSAAASEEVLTTLVQMVQHDPNNRVRESAASALGQMGSVAATETVVTALVEVALHNTNGNVRSSAAIALGQMGSAAASEEVLTTLVEVVLHAADDGVRGMAAIALGRMGSAAASEVVLTSLVEVALRAKEDGVRDSAASALGQLMAQGARLPNQKSLRIKMSIYHWQRALRKILPHMIVIAIVLAVILALGLIAAWLLFKYFPISWVIFFAFSLPFIILATRLWRAYKTLGWLSRYLGKRK